MTEESEETVSFPVYQVKGSDELLSQDDLDFLLCSFPEKWQKGEDR